MPTHRGIKLQIVSQRELKTHPEFPHPESSQFTFRSPKAEQDSFPGWTPPSVSSDSKADRLLGRQPSISVYIPSIPGARFWLRYSIDEDAASYSNWFFFKFYMNGRMVTSWGTSSVENPHGQVMRGLFEPSDRWNYKADGTVWKNMGTEAREFHFTKEEESRTAGDDGGLIEVMVYRARGRKRKAPEPPDYKNQASMPTAGLVEQPDDAKFYDWALKDPKDKPFVTFKFHYRSWESLKSLQLIPANHRESLLPPTQSLLDINRMSQKLEARMNRDMQEEQEVTFHHDLDLPSHDSISSIGSSTPWITAIFDNSPVPTRHLQRRNKFMRSLDTSESTDSPKLRSKFSTAVIDKPPSSPWKEYLDRPLPEIPVPVRRSSLKRTTSAKSSGSLSSNAPSIAPSLRSWADRDTESEAEIATATVIKIVPVEVYMRSIKRQARHSIVKSKFSDSEASPDSAASDRKKSKHSASERQEESSEDVARKSVSLREQYTEENDSPENYKSKDAGQRRRLISVHSHSTDAPKASEAVRRGLLREMSGRRLPLKERRVPVQEPVSQNQYHPYRPEYNVSDDSALKSNPGEAAPSKQHRGLTRSYGINALLNTKTYDNSADNSSVEDSFSLGPIECLLDEPSSKPSLLSRIDSKRKEVATPPPSSIFSALADMANVTKRPKRLPSTRTPIKIGNIMVAAVGSTKSSISTSSSILRPSLDKSSIKEKKVEVEDQPEMDNQTTISLTESEWMCRTPSVSPNKGSYIALPRLSAENEEHISVPAVVEQAEQEVKEEEKGGATPKLRKRTMTWYEKVRKSNDIEEAGGRSTRNSEEETSRDDVDDSKGNWI